jgi:hypothetical protein
VLRIATRDATTLMGEGPVRCETRHSRVGCIRLSQNITVKASDTAVVAHVVKDVVAAELLVHDPAAPRDEAPRKLMGVELPEADAGANRPSISGHSRQRDRSRGARPAPGA